MTTSTLTVTDFVLARIAEDEAEAWKVDAPLPVKGYATVTLTATGKIAALYVDPAHVLAQCAAIRKIVERCDDYLGDELVASDVLGALASIWSDHPDWREEWRA